MRRVRRPAICIPCTHVVVFKPVVAGGGAERLEFALPPAVMPKQRLATLKPRATNFHGRFVGSSSVSPARACAGSTFPSSPHLPAGCDSNLAVPKEPTSHYRPPSLFVVCPRFLQHIRILLQLCILIAHSLCQAVSSMSPSAMPVATDSQFGPLIDALKTAPTAPGTCHMRPPGIDGADPTSSALDAKAAADRLAREVSKVGYESLRCALATRYVHNRVSSVTVVMPI